MSKELEKIVNAIYNEQARKLLEAELNFMSEQKIELPKGKDYLRLYAETHKTDEDIINELQVRIDKAIEYTEKYVDNKCIYKGMIKKHNNKDTLLNILKGVDIDE